MRMTKKEKTDFGRRWRLWRRQCCRDGHVSCNRAASGLFISRTHKLVASAASLNFSFSCCYVHWLKYILAATTSRLWRRSVFYRFTLFRLFSFIFLFSRLLYFLDFFLFVYTRISICTRWLACQTRRGCRCCRFLCPCFCAGQLVATVTLTVLATFRHFKRTRWRPSHPPSFDSFLFSISKCKDKQQQPSLNGLNRLFFSTVCYCCGCHC